MACYRNKVAVSGSKSWSSSVVVTHHKTSHPTSPWGKKALLSEVNKRSKLMKAMNDEGKSSAKVGELPKDASDAIIRAEAESLAITSTLHLLFLSDLSLIPSFERCATASSSLVLCKLRTILKC